MRLKIKILIGVLIIGFILSGWWFLNSRAYSESKSIEVCRIVYSKDGVMEMKLNMSDSGLSLIKFEITKGFCPKYFPGNYEFVANIFSFDDKLLGEYGFSDPRIILGERGYQGPSRLDNVDFRLVIPYFANAGTVRIYSANKLMLSIYIPEYYTRLEGNVTDYNGLPVSDTYVEIWGADATSIVPDLKPGKYKKVVVGGGTSTVTDVDGDYELLIEPGEYKVIVNPAGETNLMRAVKPINILHSEYVSVDFNLQPCGSIAGKVTDVYGNPIKEAWVQIVGYLTPQYKVQEGGSYLIPWLKPGEYKIKAFVQVGQDDIDIPPKSVEVELGKTCVADFVFDNR